MSFFGKSYKKVKTENVKELMQALDISDKVREVLAHPEALTSYTKNADGSITYVVEVNGVKALNETFQLDVEAEYMAPDGKKSKNIFTLEGNVLKSTTTRQSGQKIFFVRTFEGNSMKMEVAAEGVDTKSTVYYEAV